MRPKHSKDNLIILFDLDGTLIDSTEAILFSFAEAFREFRVKKPDDEKIKALIGYPLKRMFVDLGVDEVEAEKFVDAYKKSYRKIHTQKTKLLPGAKEALEEFIKYARLGVVTTKTAKYSRELLEHFGIAEMFEILVGSEDVKNHKPDPEPINRALELMGVSKSNTKIYMIGDTCLDMLSAKGAKVLGVAVLCGYGTKEQLSKCSDISLPNVKDALKKILELEKIS
jgi:phosphoglycolate phosphatase